MIELLGLRIFIVIGWKGFLGIVEEGLIGELDEF